MLYKNVYVPFPFSVWDRVWNLICIGSWSLPFRLLGASTQPTSVCYRKRFWVFSIILDPWKHAIVELSYRGSEPVWRAKRCHNFPKTIATMSNVLVIMKWSTICSWHFSTRSWFSVKIMSNVPLSFLNPHWLSGTSLIEIFIQTIQTMFANIFPAIDNKEMPLWLSHTWGFPFCLYRWIMAASCGISSFLHMQWNISVSFSAIVGPPALLISAGIASDPGALSNDSCWIACVVSGQLGIH